MHAQSKKYQALALFDFDGTLCQSDSFTRFIFFALPKRRILRKGLRSLPWITAYYLKLYPAHRMRPRLFRQMFAGISRQHLQDQAQLYAQNILKKQLDPALLKQLKQHQQLGHHVVLVSASVHVYLAPLCQDLSLDLICSEVDLSETHISGRYCSPDCSLEQKKQRVLEAYSLKDYEKIYAYGNSHEDFAMFSIAHHTYFVGKDRKMPDLSTP